MTANYCELCGKETDIDYYSAADCNETAAGVVLHEQCAHLWEFGARPLPKAPMTKVYRATLRVVDERGDATLHVIERLTPFAITVVAAGDEDESVSIDVVAPVSPTFEQAEDDDE